METSALPIAFDTLKPFFDVAPTGISILDSYGTIVFANKLELELLGYNEEEYVRHNISEFHRSKVALNYIWKCLSQHKSFYNQEATLVCHDGSVKEVLISSSVDLSDQTDNVIICFTRDISALKKAERHLKFLNKASEELASTLDTKEALDKITALIVPEFADWIVINELREDGLGHLIKMAHADPQKAIWAEKYRRAHPVDINDQQVGSVGWAMRTGQSLLVTGMTDEIIKRGAKDEEQRQLLRQLSIQSVMIVPMQVHGRVTGVISFMSCNAGNRFTEDSLSFAKDLTNHIALTLDNARLYAEVKRDMEKIIQADQQKDEFISIASHELKTPITTLKAYTQILQANFDRGQIPATSDMLSKMNKQINKLQNLVVDLLDITKIETGEMAFQFEEFDFNELVIEVAEEMQRTADTHTIRLQLNPCEKIVADRNRLGQVITNFISNGIKYSPDASEIIIITECEDNTVKLSVTDFGVGIPEDQQSQIFKRFFRARRENGNSFPGLGLGLYICSEIMRRHHGKIAFKSDEGHGSTFSFEISAVSVKDKVLN